MKYETIVVDFLNEFPEFAEAAERERKYWQSEGEETPLAYVFFGDVINPYLEGELEKHHRNELLLKRIFDFLERMAISKDDRIRDLLGAGITEVFGDNALRLKNARKYMGPYTRKNSDDMERSWGRLFNLEK